MCVLFLTTSLDLRKRSSFIGSVSPIKADAHPQASMLVFSTYACFAILKFFSKTEMLTLIFSFMIVSSLSEDYLTIAITKM